MSELTTALAPDAWGNPDTLHALGRHCSRIAQALEEDARQVRPGTTVATWSGEAARAFVETIRVVPRDLSLAAASYQAVGQALTAYAAALEPLRRRGRALESEVAGLQLRRVTECDPLRKGELVMQEAELQRQLTGLRMQAYDVALQCQRRVLAACNPPHQRPGWLHRAVDAAGDWVEEHADLLEDIATICGWAAALLAAAGCIPGLQGLLVVAAVAAVARLAIDAALWSRGRSSAGQVLGDAVDVVPSGRAAKQVATRGMRLSERLRVGAKRYAEQESTPGARVKRASSECASAVG